MPDLTISAAATLNATTIAGGDLIPVVDVSASAGSKGSKITKEELQKAFADPVTAIGNNANITTDADTAGYYPFRTLTATWSDSGHTINMPTNGTIGQIIEYQITASGAARGITLNSAIKTAYGVTFEATIASGNVRVMQLKKQATNVWLMVKNIEFTP